MTLCRNSVIFNLIILEDKLKKNNYVQHSAKVGKIFSRGMGR